MDIKAKEQSGCKKPTNKHKVFMVFNATFNNISVSVYRGGFISGGNWSTRRKLPRKYRADESS
jgi:hypothetical protein